MGTDMENMTPVNAKERAGGGADCLLRMAMFNVPVLMSSSVSAGAFLSMC